MTLVKVLPKPTPHPLFHRLKSLKIPLLRVSHFLNVPHTTLYLQVSGYKDMAPELKKKLVALLHRVEKWGAQ
jgi:hypothetical protein